MPAGRRSFPFPPTPHTLDLSRLEDFQSLDSQSKSYSMAYPFPRFASAPQTPQHVPDPEKSSPMGHPKDSAAGSKRTAITAFVVLALFLWIISPLSGTPGKSNVVSSVVTPDFVLGLCLGSVCYKDLCERVLCIIGDF